VVVRSAGWNEESASEVPEYEVDEEPLAECPTCHRARVVETSTQFICADRLKDENEWALKKAQARAAGHKAPRRKAGEKEQVCGFVLPRTVCKREITRDEAIGYIQNGRTELLTDFTSRFGRPFSAILHLKENGRHGFEFPPRGAAAAAADAAGEGQGTRAAGRKVSRKSAKATGSKSPARRPRHKKAARKKTGKSGKTGSARRKKAPAPKDDGN